MIGDLAGFRAYHTARGNAGPTDATDADATAALQRGSDLIRRGFSLTVAETDERVIDAAYVAAGYEMNGSALVAAPGFWQSPASDKVLTEVKGIKWAVKTGDEPAKDAMTPRQVLRGILGSAVSVTWGPVVV